MASASSTYTSLTICNLEMTIARCTGFTKVHGQNEYTYVIDLEWTDDRVVSIKRTFCEFQQFNNNLVKLFPELHNSKLNLKTSLRENFSSLFTKDKRVIAEKRELILDIYLSNLLRQPERIRRSNLVLAFFDSRDSDPKPCKSNSPSEKSDSGIDLTGDKSISRVDHDSPTHSVATQDNDDTDEHYLNVDCPVEASCDQEADEYTDEEYEGDTSDTETDDEAYDEDYFLDVGFGELMLQNSVDEEQEVPVSPSADIGESSMWCSNLDKFSNILRTSMTNLSNIDNQKPLKVLKPLTSIDDEEGDNSDIIDDLIAENSDMGDENSETESQLTGDDRGVTEHYNSSDEDTYQPLPLSKNNMRHYYLSSNNLNSVM